MSPAPGALTVLIADTSRGEDLLADVLAEFDDCRVVGVAHDAEHAISLAAAHAPQVALLHAAVPGGGGAHATRGICAASPLTRVVALADGDDDDLIAEMLDAGARAQVGRDAGSRELRRLLRQYAGPFVPEADHVSHTVVAEIDAELGLRRSHDLRRARGRQAITDLLAGRGLRMVVQPIRRLVSGEVLGYEALSRFAGDDMGTSEWFERAHACGLGADLEVAALRAATEQAWAAVRPRGDAYLAINVSPSTLGRPDALAILDLLPPERTVVELTEHELITDAEHLAALGEVRSRGIRIAIDDIGAGFAGLQRLLTLRPDIIKLDRSVVATIENDASRRALTRALAGFAEELGIALIAEGVERWSQSVALCELGVALGQGFLLGAPA
jgi:EAL domain-containing protein (putative c-di-GMP-specific phosphodiesterase class I)